MAVEQGGLDPEWRQKYPIPQSLGEPAFLGWATNLQSPQQRQLLNEVVQEGMASLGLEGLGLHKFVDVRRGENNHLIFSKATGEDPHGSSINAYFENILKVRESYLAGEPFNGLVGRLWPAIEETLEKHNGVRRMVAEDGIWLDVRFPIPVTGSMQVVAFPGNAMFYETDILERATSMEANYRQEGLTETDMYIRRRALIAEVMQEQLDRTGAKERFPAKSRGIRLL